jgi:hypothetical protein
LAKIDPIFKIDFKKLFKKTTKRLVFQNPQIFCQPVRFIPKHSTLVVLQKVACEDFNDDPSSGGGLEHI